MGPAAPHAVPRAAPVTTDAGGREFVYWSVTGEVGNGRCTSAEEGSQPVPGGQRYFSVRTLDTRDRNLSQAAWASAVKSAGKCEATVTSTQWDSSCGRAAVLRWAGAQGAETPPPPRPQPGPAHLEVERVHAQDVGVQLAELGQRARHIVDVLDRVAQGGHHLGAVRAQVRRARVQVEVRKVGLGLRVAGEEPAQPRCQSSVGGGFSSTSWRSASPSPRSRTRMQPRRRPRSFLLPLDSQGAPHKLHLFAQRPSSPLPRPPLGLAPHPNLANPGLCFPLVLFLTRSA